MRKHVCTVFNGGIFGGRKVSKENDPKFGNCETYKERLRVSSKKKRLKKVAGGIKKTVSTH